MTTKLTKAETKFKNYFFTDNGILDSTMNHIQGKMQAEASIEECDELEESFFKNAMVNILRRKVRNINSSYTVTSNKTYPKFCYELAKFSESKLRIQPDFIIKDRYGMPLSVIELKSIFGTGTTKAMVLKDIARLVLYKKLFPKCQCIFVIAGKKDEMNSFFKESNFKFENNVTKRVRIPYSWNSFQVDDLRLKEENLVKAFKNLNIREVQLKLSRTQYGQKYHSMSYIVRDCILGYRPASDFIRTTWDNIIIGDFVTIGIKPVKNIGQCKIVDNIDIDLQQVMFQTNEVDNQIWTEIKLDEIVWKYSPQGNKC